MNLTKFEYKHHELLDLYLRVPRSTTPLFCTHATWLSRAPFYFEEKDTFLYLYKKSQIFGRDIFYHLGHPLHFGGNLVKERKATLDLLESGVDMSMSLSQMHYLGLWDTPDLTPYHLDPTPSEFVYKGSDYFSLEGGKWKSWRYAVKQAQAENLIRIYDTDNLPALVEQRLNEILSKWKVHKDKYINRHYTWYTKDIRKLKNAVVTIYYDKESLIPYYFNISQSVGKTVFILDIKMARDDMKNSSSLAKAAHVFLAGYWRKVLGDEFNMLTGVGDKQYTHKGKVYDLDKNKGLLRPSSITKVYKIRAAKGV